MWYNVVLDFLIVSDASGVVYLIENTLYYTLKNNLKVSIRSDKKQPFFSLGYSYRTSGNHVSPLTTETHCKMEGSTPDNQKPYFSFGFFRSKSDESTQSSSQNSEDSKNEESKAVASKKPSTKNRVKVNKSDILSGSYGASKSSESGQKTVKDKAKVDQNKIDEILKRIERHTGKSGSAKEEKQSYGQLINDIKQDAHKDEKVINVSQPLDSNKHEEEKSTVEHDKESNASGDEAI
jgi:hypothetical protein